MAGYKKDQGRMARMAVFWSIAVLLYYGCTSLRQALAGSFKDSLGQPLFASFQKVPVLGTQLTGALLISVVVFAAALVAVYRFLERPKYADMLIETETEMRKVVWPTPKEVFDSSLVVVICVVFLMAFLAGTDWLLARLIQPLIFQRSA
jgi:preprotein translocase SecE subunit